MQLCVDGAPRRWMNEGHPTSIKISIRRIITRTVWQSGLSSRPPRRRARPFPFACSLLQPNATISFQPVSSGLSSNGLIEGPQLLATLHQSRARRSALNTMAVVDISNTTSSSTTQNSSSNCRRWNRLFLRLSAAIVVINSFRVIFSQTAHLSKLLVVDYSLLDGPPVKQVLEEEVSTQQHQAIQHMQQPLLQSSNRKHKNNKGAFVIMARNKPDNNNKLKKTLDKLYQHYNNREHDDILILHEGDFDDATQYELQLNGTRREIQFLPILKGDLWTVYPPNLDLGDKANSSEGWSVNYMHMCRFFAVLVYPTLHEMGYTWVCRFDDDSLLLSDVGYNIFEFMEKNGYDYGYRATQVSVVTFLLSVLLMSL